MKCPVFVGVLVLLATARHGRAHVAHTVLPYGAYTPGGEKMRTLDDNAMRLEL